MTFLWPRIERKTLASAAGRAYPDVAAQGQNFRVILGGRTISVGGTSASSPVRCVSTLHINISLMVA